MTPTSLIIFALVICFIIAAGYVINKNLPDEEIDQPPRDDKVTWWPDDPEDR